MWSANALYTRQSPGLQFFVSATPSLARTAAWLLHASSSRYHDRAQTYHFATRNLRPHSTRLALFQHRGTLYSRTMFDCSSKCLTLTRFATLMPFYTIPSSCMQSMKAYRAPSHALSSQCRCLFIVAPEMRVSFLLVCNLSALDLKALLLHMSYIPHLADHSLIQPHFHLVLDAP